MSTVDTSGWSPDTEQNVSIGDIPLNADAGIQQTWQALRILMAAVKGDGDAIKAMIDVMQGATASADGASGLVPKPEAGDQNKVLKGDGTWDNAPTPNLGTASRAVVTDGNGAIAVSNVTSTELGYLSGATSNVQTQLNAKAADSEVVHTSGAEIVAGEKTFMSLVRMTQKDLGFQCEWDVYSMAFKVGVGGVNRGIWDYYLNKWIVYQTSSNAFFNGTVNSSSDERLKTSIQAVPDPVLDAWGDVQWSQFMYLAEREAGGAPIHVGIIAQRVLEAFKAHGIDAESYGIVCREEREDGSEGYWMVRYIEAFAMEAACQRRRADALEQRIAILEAKLSKEE